MSRPKTVIEPKKARFLPLFNVNLRKPNFFLNKAKFLPLFNVNLSQPQVNSTSTQFHVNFDSTSSQPHFNLSLKSTKASISTSTLYSCDLKATQFFFILAFSDSCRFILLLCPAICSVGYFDIFFYQTFEIVDKSN